ncbi:MAG: hypothetical protein IJB71_03325 [Bacilli bacterium]|nr:hypothetical protein [Bacilli bacterium]
MKKRIKYLLILFLLLVNITNVNAARLGQSEYEDYGMKRAYVIGNYVFDLSKHNPTLGDLMIANQTNPIGKASIIEIKIATNIDGEKTREYRELLTGTNLDEFPDIDVNYIYGSEIKYNNPELEDKIVLEDITNSELAQDLYSYLATDSDLNNFYHNTKLTKANLPQSVALVPAFFHENQHYSLDNTTLQRKAKMMFGLDLISTTTMASMYGGNYIEYNSTQTDYDQADTWVFGGYVDYGPINNGKIIKVTKADDYIYIYDNYVNKSYSIEDDCTIDTYFGEITCDYYGDSGKDEVTGWVVLACPEPGENSEDYCSTGNLDAIELDTLEIVEEKYTYTEYKHVFKKHEDSNDYYWVSSEKLDSSKEVDITKTKVAQDLYSYLATDSDLNSFYHNTKLTKANLPQSTALVPAFFYQNNNYYLDDTALQRKAKRMFGFDSIAKTTVGYWGFISTVEYNSIQTEYVPADSWQQTGEKAAPGNSGELIKVIKAGDYIYIYDNYVNKSYVDDDCKINTYVGEITCNYYGELEKKEVTGSVVLACPEPGENSEDYCSIENLDAIEVDSLEIVKEDYEYTEYKHIFKKHEDSDDYYWVSSEKKK